jgi:hypothetical protein
MDQITFIILPKQMTYTPSLKDIILAILLVVIVWFIRTNNAKWQEIKRAQTELKQRKNDKHANANQELQQSYRSYRECAGNIIDNLACIDREGHNIAEAKKLINDDTRYYRMKLWSGYIDIRHDSLTEFLSIQE